MVFQYIPNEHVLGCLHEYEMNIERRLSKGDLPNERFIDESETSKRHHIKHTYALSSPLTNSYDKRQQNLIYNS